MLGDTLDLIVIVLFLLANLAIGWITKKNVTSFSHFAIGNRSFNSAIICMTLSATFIGGGYTIGNAGKVYSHGMVYAFALLGFSLKEMLVALFIAPRMGKYMDCFTVGDIVERSYGVVAKVITGFLSIIICMGIVGAQVGAINAILIMFFNIPPELGVIISFFVFIFYSMLGGMRAVVYTNILQFIVLIIGIPAIFVFGFYLVGGASGLLHAVPSEHIFSYQNEDNWRIFLNLFIVFLVGETLVPPYVQRLLMSRHTNDIKYGTLYSGLLSVPFFLVVGLIGLVAYALNPQLSSDNMALTYVASVVLPPVIKGFVISAILAVIMSSAAGFLNASAVALIQDVVRPLKKNGLSEKQALTLARVNTFIIGVGALVFALSIQNVLDILIYAYNFWAPMVLVPIVLAIFTGTRHKALFYVCGITGALSSLGWEFVFQRPFGVSPIVVGVGMSIIVAMLVTFIPRVVSTSRV